MKRFAPFVVLLGIFFALLSGGTPAAARTTDGYECMNSAVLILSCNKITVSPTVEVRVEVGRVLTSTEVGTVVFILTFTDVTVENLSGVKLSLVDAASNFNPPTTIGTVYLYIGTELVAWA